MSKQIKYFVKNIETGETIEVLPWQAGNGVYRFNEASLAQNDPEQDASEFMADQTVYEFANGTTDADNDGSIDEMGAFVNNDIVQLDVTGKWDIFKTEINEEVAEESSVDETVPLE